MVPLPFVGDEVTEYIALKATPGFGPLGAPMSSVPVISPVGGNAVRRELAGEDNLSECRRAGREASVRALQCAVVE